MANGNLEVTVGRIDERVNDLENFKNKHEEEHIRLMETLEKIQNRPSWAVTALITSMASAIVYLLMKVVGG